MFTLRDYRRGVAGDPKGRGTRDQVPEAPWGPERGFRCLDGCYGNRDHSEALRTVSQCRKPVEYLKGTGPGTKNCNNAKRKKGKKKKKKKREGGAKIHKNNPAKRQLRIKKRAVTSVPGDTAPSKGLWRERG